MAGTNDNEKAMVQSLKVILAMDNTQRVDFFKALGQIVEVENDPDAIVEVSSPFGGQKWINPKTDEGID